MSSRDEPVSSGHLHFDLAPARSFRGFARSRSRAIRPARSMCQVKGGPSGRSGIAWRNRKPRCYRAKARCRVRTAPCLRRCSPVRELRSRARAEVAIAHIQFPLPWRVSQILHAVSPGQDLLGQFHAQGRGLGGRLAGRRCGGKDDRPVSVHPHHRGGRGGLPDREHFSSGTISPAAVRTLSRVRSSICRVNRGSAWTVTGHIRPNMLKSVACTPPRDAWSVVKTSSNSTPSVRAAYPDRRSRRSLRRRPQGNLARLTTPGALASLAPTRSAASRSRSSPRSPRVGQGEPDREGVPPGRHGRQHESQTPGSRRAPYRRSRRSAALGGDLDEDRGRGRRARPPRTQRWPTSPVARGSGPWPARRSSRSAPATPLAAAPRPPAGGRRSGRRPHRTASPGASRDAVGLPELVGGHPPRPRRDGDQRRRLAVDASEPAQREPISTRATSFTRSTSPLRVGPQDHIPELVGVRQPAGRGDGVVRRVVADGPPATTWGFCRFSASTTSPADSCRRASRSGFTTPGCRSPRRRSPGRPRRRGSRARSFFR